MSHTPEASSPELTPTSPPSHTLDFLESLTLFSRFLLVPLFVGLGAAMLLYCYVFFKEEVHIFREVFSGEAGSSSAETSLLMGVLSLLDMSMIANLIIMATVGGWSIFIREISPQVRPPRFLKTLTAGGLKIKMGASLIGVSSIHLLRSFIEAGSVDWPTLTKQLSIHGAFILGVIALTWMDYKAHTKDAH